MARQRGGQSTRVRQWSRLGLLLVALFLGHDVLMAAEAHATPAVDHQGRHAAFAHPSGDDPATVHLDGRESHHPGGCSVGTVAVPRSDDAAGRIQAHAAVVHPTTVEEVTPRMRAATFAWEAPHWPPGVLRALCQVYRM